MALLKLQHELLLLVVQISNSPSTNLFGNIPKPIQESSKLASSTSCAALK